MLLSSSPTSGGTLLVTAAYLICCLWERQQSSKLLKWYSIFFTQVNTVFWVFLWFTYNSSKSNHYPSRLQIKQYCRSPSKTRKSCNRRLHFIKDIVAATKSERDCLKSSGTFDSFPFTTSLAVKELFMKLLYAAYK